MAPKILITGGTGYVGGRLIPLLDEHGGELELRLMARKPEYLRARVGDGIEIVSGDVTQPESLATVLDGIDTAYYLIHSMGSGGDFEHQDRDAARNFAIAAKTCLLISSLLSTTNRVTAEFTRLADLIRCPTVI